MYLPSLGVLCCATPEHRHGAGVGSTFPAVNARSAHAKAGRRRVKFVHISVEKNNMDGYVKERALGRGAMGAVFLVRRHTDGLRLAMKTVAIE